jgi:hypothetical protein
MKAANLLHLVFDMENHLAFFLLLYNGFTYSNT